MIRAVVVFPFVPVTAMIFTPRERSRKISFLKKSANFPGKVVAPLPKKRSIFSHNFAAATRIAIIIINYIAYKIYYDKIVVKKQKGGNLMLEEMIAAVRGAQKNTRAPMATLA